MAESSHLYQYAPLEGPNSFRILEILPGQDGEPLRCNIIHVSMDEKPEYEALSYVWSLGKATIYCGSSNAIFRVSVTCLRALKYLRLRDKSRNLWIDAICINQEDSPAAIEEKDQQVKMMHKIYENASRVLIYPMGLHKLQTWDVCILLRLVNVQVDDRHQEKVPIPRQYQDVARSLDKDYDRSELFIPEVYAIARRMEWFSRTWVIQEAALAKKAIMILEKAEVPFHKILDQFMKTFKPHDEFRERLLIHASLKKTSTPRPSLLQLAYSSRCAKATRPEDKLCALVGIASDREHFQSAISYGKSLATVFADFSQRFINQTRNLDLLSVVRECPPSEDFPSWAVQWHTMNVKYRSVLDPLGSRKNFEACGDFTSTERQGPNTHELHLRGIKFDSVRLGSKMVPEEHFYVGGALRRLFPLLEGEICRLFGQSPKGHAQTCVVYNDFGKAITNTFSFGEMKMDEQDTRAVVDLLFKGFQRGDDFSSSVRTMGSELVEYVLRRTDYYVFVKTSRGYIGLVDKSVFKGDVICILSGGSVPYVLRPVPGEEGKYQFIGEAYIEGIMYGEAMEGKEEKDLQDFILV
ncbi:heterokaryon incompatibility protein-domain-containing protein [Phyllosticta capitalensis]